LIRFSLWAATGQNALESSRILVLSASATSTSILKNLVLPGIGHFTILDASNVTPEDAGNNFFLDGPDSIGKNRAEEAVRLLGELNDGVGGKAVKESVDEVLAKQPDWVKGFTLVIAHNLQNNLLEKLSTLLWEDEAGPPLVVVKSAGFLAEFFIQFRDHSGGLRIAYCRIFDQV
jgi:amyloid beta precursor protein binding protein 1